MFFISFFSFCLLFCCYFSGGSCCFGLLVCHFCFALLYFGLAWIGLIVCLVECVFVSVFFGLGVGMGVLLLSFLLLALCCPVGWV